MTDAIDESKSALAGVRGEVATLTSELAAARAEHARMEAEPAPIILANLQTEHAQLISARTELSERITKSAVSLDELESRVGLRGLELGEVVAPQHGTAAADARADLVTLLNHTQDPLRRGELANQIRRLDQERNHPHHK